MKKLFTLLSLMALMLAGCSNEDVFTEGIVQEELDTTIKKVTITIPEFEMGGAVTRTIISKDLQTKWSSSDAIGIYPTNGEQIKFKIKTGAETSTAVFDAGDWGLKSTSKYAAYYPYQNSENTEGGTLIPFSLRGQKQMTNDNTSHLGKYDFMVASAKAPTGNSIDFQFQHLNSVLCIEVPAPLSAQYTQLTLTAPESAFAQSATLDVHDGTITKSALSASFSIELDNIFVDSTEPIKVWMMIAPTNLSGKNLTVTLKNRGGAEYKFEQTIQGENFEAGKVYSRNLSEKGFHEVTSINMGYGSYFNQDVKRLANYSTSLSYSSADSRIKKIRFVTNTTDTGTKVGDNPSVYGSFDSSTGVMEIRTAADKFKLGSTAAYLFSNLTALEEIEHLDYLDTSETSDMAHMFDKCWTLTNLNLSSFNTSKVYGMAYMFSDCERLKQLDVSNFDTHNVSNMSSMFSNCTSLSYLDLGNFDTSKVQSMDYLFSECGNLSYINLSSFNTSSVTKMSYMFDGCHKLTSLDLSHFDTSKVEDMAYMFAGCSSLKNLNISGFSTSNVTLMSFMFYNCASLENLDVSGFNTAEVTRMNSMFTNCKKLTNLDLSHFDTSFVTTMTSMFERCESLVYLDLSNFRTNHVTNMESMFKGCTNLKGLDISYFNTENVTTMASMFQDCHYMDYIVMGRKVDGVVETDFWIKNETVRTNILKNLGIYATNKTNNKCQIYFATPTSTQSPSGAAPAGVRLRSGDTGWDSDHVNVTSVRV